MNALTQLLHMNGDGVFVWPCYIAAFVVLLGNVIVARRRHRHLSEEIMTQSTMERSQ